MSKGPGKLQTAIVNSLKARSDWRSIGSLVYSAYGLEDETPTPAQIKATHRAVNGLIARGIVEKKRSQVWASGKRRGPRTYDERWGQGNGLWERGPALGKMSCVFVRLSVESKAMCPKPMKVSKREAHP